MVSNFKHKGLRLFYRKEDGRKLPPEQIPKIRRVLTALDMAKSPEDLWIPGFLTHPLEPRKSGQLAIKVTANWRIVFRFEHGDVHDVDLVDYH